MRWLSLSCHEPNCFSERGWHYHTAGEATFPLSFHLSPAVPIQPSIFFFISLCHLAPVLKFIYVLFLFFTSLSPLFVFVHSLYFLLFTFPSSPSPLNGYQLSLFLSPPLSIRVSRLDSCPSAVFVVSTIMLAADGECLAK